MTVKELKKILTTYSDDKKVLVVCNQCQAQEAQSISKADWVTELGAIAIFTS